ARHVNEGHNRNIEAVAEAYEASGFGRSINIQDPGEESRLVGDDADRSATEPGEADHHITGKILVHFKKVVFVYDGADDVFNVIGLVGIIWDQGIQLLVSAVRVITGRPERRVFHVVAGQETEKLTDGVEALAFTRRGKMCHPAPAVTTFGATE